MKFIIDDSLESLIYRIAGPVEIICKDGVNYEIIGVPQDKVSEVRNNIKKYLESKGKVFNEID